MGDVGCIWAVVDRIFNRIFVIVIVKATLCLGIDLLEDLDHLTTWCEFGDDAGDFVCLCECEDSLLSEDVELCYGPG